MSEKKNSRVNTYVAVTGAFCALIMVVSATDPSPALRVPILIGSAVVLMIMAFLLGKEARAQKSSEKELDDQV